MDSNPRLRSTRLPRLAGTVLAVGALAGAVVMLRGSSSEAGETGRGSPRVVAGRSTHPTVAVGRAETNDTQRRLRFAGVTRSHRDANLAFILPGRVQSVAVELGQHVEAGQVLARLDARDHRRALRAARASVSRAQAQLDLGRQTHDRVTRLARRNAATTAQLDESSAQAKVLTENHRYAQTQLAQAERAHAESVLRAPFGGTITGLPIEVGEFAGPGQTVMQIAEDTGTELEVEVPESSLPLVQEGATVAVDLTMLGEHVQGTVRSVTRASSRRQALYPVVVALPRGLPPGLTAEMRLEWPTGRGVAVPLESVVRRPGAPTQVWRVEADQVRALDVHVVAMASDRAIVEAELSPGDRVVVRGQAGLTDGRQVVPVEQLGLIPSSSRAARGAGAANP
ncbi:MAG: efflux RND transporter periplasmic adaptor subunit [Myxococcales bacterium FL481]|nr:MAG: efflux RND transporter periplasmic adaptor subunit [Myxococcales bacterium FL481]